MYSWPSVYNMVKISGPNRSAKITDHFTCISVNVICCVTCLCKKIYIGETGRRLAGRFREYLRDVEENDTDASKIVAIHFNLPNHTQQNIAICCWSYCLPNFDALWCLLASQIYSYGDHGRDDVALELFYSVLFKRERTFLNVLQFR